MEVESKDVGRVVVVRPLTKRIDASTSIDFKSQLLEIIQDGNTIIVLNLSLVDFIDSSGLGVIVSTMKLLKTKNGLFAIFGISYAVMNLFKLTAMDKVFEIYANEKEAVAALEAKISELPPSSAN